VRLYPNPADDQINWKSTGSSGSWVVEIISMNGKLVKHEITTNYGISVTDLLPGLYLFRATAQSGEVYTARLMKR